MNLRSSSNRAEQSELERAALSRLRQLLMEPFLMHGSWVRHRRVCGKGNCACATDKQARHVSWYVRQMRKGKPRMKYVRPELYMEIRKWVSRYWEARALLDKVSESSWKRLKALSR
jgi:hypothetical protein